MKILDWGEQVDLLSREINSLGDGLTILEAGCGRGWPLNLSVEYRLVGVDPDEKALTSRVAEVGDLDEYHVSTLIEATFPEQSFDVIYCSFVLEHVIGVQRVLENFARWLKPNGIIILTVPDHRSVYGFLARHTPHWFHILVKKFVFGMPNAGKPGYGPYPVVYEPAMEVSALRRFAAEHGYSISVSGNGYYLVRAPYLKPFVMALSWLSLGSLKWRHCDLAIVMRA